MKPIKLAQCRIHSSVLEMTLWPSG